jgi:hypothetical protein
LPEDLGLQRLSQKGTQPNATVFLALTIQALTKPNCFDLYLCDSLFRPGMKGGCRQRSANVLTSKNEMKAFLYGETTTVSAHAADYRVLRLRLEDRHARALQEQARAVNFLWNYCNELSVKVLEREQRFLSGYGFHPFTKGAGKAGLGLHSGTIHAVVEEYATRRKQARKAKLRWRVSHGTRRSLRWIPCESPRS